MAAQSRDDIRRQFKQMDRMQVRTKIDHFAEDTVNMERLKQLDQVAYVRFASVYRSFQDIAEFRDAIERLESDTALVKSDT